MLAVNPSITKPDCVVKAVMPSKIGMINTKASNLVISLFPIKKAIEPRAEITASAIHFVQTKNGRRLKDSVISALAT